MLYITATFTISKFICCLRNKINTIFCFPKTTYKLFLTH